MVPTALTVAPLLLAAVLAVAGLAKLRSPGTGASSLRSLGVPRALAIPTVAAAHPWVEVTLALLLTLGTGVLGVLSAGASLALVLTYLWLVIQVLRRGDDVDCDCFGAFGPARVTAATAVRNGWYVVLACLSIWAYRADVGPRDALQRMDGNEWWWLAATAAAGLTVILTVGGPDPGRASSPGFVDEAELEDYLRTPTPAVPVTLSDGSVRSLRDLSATRPQVLLFVSTTCGLCTTVIDQIPAWRAALPMLDVRLAYIVPPPSGADGDEWTIYDPERWAYDTLGIEGTPSAVALGADGQLAGGPVAGPDNVTRFIADLVAELGHLVVNLDRDSDGPLDALPRGHRQTY
ncbi:TlpA family protein disulfide reductase [Terrabacter sp. RAF57]|uniref:TlpA family protein disulfide reductase n=1 Tax=Terrabacter sp. RAF57 TaxID=3233063 RepID=UPI003F944144